MIPSVYPLPKCGVVGTAVLLMFEHIADPVGLVALESRLRLRPGAVLEAYFIVGGCVWGCEHRRNSAARANRIIHHPSDPMSVLKPWIEAQAL
eukprot:3522329-Amphidinium_carterae.2